MRDFKKLKVWEKSHSLTLSVYRATTHFPKDEQFGLVSQMRRASTSVPANIAEGCGRQGDAEFARFLHIALGSASELEYHTLLSHELSMLNDETYKHISDEVTQVKRMLATLIQRLRAEI